jgi:hypothetical protein
VRHKQYRRLSEEQIEDMAEQYLSGLTVYQLAEVFGIARQTRPRRAERELAHSPEPTECLDERSEKQTVGIILRRHGVDTRRRNRGVKAP